MDISSLRKKNEAYFLPEIYTINISHIFNLTVGDILVLISYICCSIYTFNKNDLTVTKQMEVVNNHFCTTYRRGIE